MTPYSFVSKFAMTPCKIIIEIWYDPVSNRPAPYSHNSGVAGGVRRVRAHHPVFFHLSEKILPVGISYIISTNT